MKTPLNVRWHYRFHARHLYRDSTNTTILQDASYNYTLKNGNDEFFHRDIPIKVSRLAELIKLLPFAEDFEKPVYEERDKNGLHNIDVIPGKMLYIALHYYTLSYDNKLSLSFIKKDEDVYELSLFKEMFHLDTHERAKKKEEKLLTKAEAQEFLSKLPETIELGIFNLPLGNCFECKPVED